MKAAISFPDISAEIFRISAWGMDFALRWYAMAYIVGILIGWRMIVAAVEHSDLWDDHSPVMTKRQVEELLTWIILGVVLGGRIGFVLFYQPAYYLANPKDILKFWEGGMAFHGGLLGVIAACVLYSLKQRIYWLSVADLLCMATPPGLLLGRIANFVNAELWGRPTNLPWGVIFPGYNAQDCIDVQGICARHPSQLYEAALEGLLLGGVCLWLVYRNEALKLPGQITGFFLAGYGIARFLVEFVRQPDAHFQNEGNPLGLAIHINGYGLTMGQLLSLPMIIIGIGLLIWVKKNK
ncbi:MAG: prolipoprotein diacylglyceryl transferase [Roseovarius sp.]|nr:prolipoprotein diacylglyceryl transferase [Roseovarius sp.]